MQNMHVSGDTKVIIPRLFNVHAENACLIAIDLCNNNVSSLSVPG